MVKIPFTNIQWNAATASRRLLDKGLIQKDYLKTRLLDGLNKEADKYALEMAKKGKDITVADVEREIMKDAEFVKLCDCVGISKSDLSDIAHGAFRKYKKVVGQNAP